MCFFNMGCEAWAKGELALEINSLDATTKGELSGSEVWRPRRAKMFKGTRLCLKEIVDFC